MSDHSRNVFRVSLRDPYGGGKVNFDVTPDLSETRQVNYKTIEPVHMPGQLYVYNNTTARSFSLTGIKLISRTQTEADLNMARLRLLRAWTMPRFGACSSTLTKENRKNRQLYAYEANNNPNSPEYERVEDWVAVNPTQRQVGTERLGAPPPVLFLSAYAQESDRSPGHLRRIPVVINSLSINYPSDVTYIPSTSGQPMATVMTVDIQLLETHSPSEYSKFSLDDFRRGRLRGF